MSDLKTLKAPELEAEIAKYRGLVSGESEIEVPEAFKNNAERVSFLSNARENFGVPHEVTEEDLKDNPDLTVGEVVLVPYVAPVAPEKASGGGKTGLATANQGSADAAPILVFRGREVISAVNKVVNGRLFKEVSTTADTQLLTEEEFEKEVTERK